MQDAETRTSSELDNNEQAGGTQDALTSEDTFGSQVSEPFTDVTLEDINRDDLSPEMQSAYDEMLKRYSDMNRDYSHKTQAISSVNKDAENWRTAMSHPVIAPALSDMVAQANSGMPVEAPTYTRTPAPTEQTIDPEVDPVGAVVERFGKVVDEKIQAAISPLQKQMGQVSGYVGNTQAQSEFQELARKFPAVESVGINAINNLRSRYSTSMGRQISLEEAIALYAVQNDPSILTPRPPASQTRTPPTSPRVEPPKTSTGGREETPVPDTIAKLREAATAKDFKPSLGDAVKRGLARFSQRGGE